SDLPTHGRYRTRGGHHVDADSRGRVVDGSARLSMYQRWNRFWFAEVPPEIYALLRILFGAVGCVTLIGLANVPVSGSCTRLVASSEGALCASLLSRGLGYGPVTLLIFALASFAAMTVGYRTRWAMWCALLSIYALARWNDLPLSAAHQVLRAVLFCLVWADCGAVWSVDSVLRQRRSASGSGRRASMWPLRLLQIQVAAIYLVTALWKLDNVMWRDGSALH